MPNLDRFACGPDDPQDEESLTYCAGCGGELYPGDKVYVVNDAIVCNTSDCLQRYLDPEEISIEDALDALSIA